MAARSTCASPPAGPGSTRARRSPARRCVRLFASVLRRDPTASSWSRRWSGSASWSRTRPSRRSRWRSPATAPAGGSRSAPTSTISSPSTPSIRCASSATRPAASSPTSGCAARCGRGSRGRSPATSSRSARSGSATGRAVRSRRRRLLLSDRLGLGGRGVTLRVPADHHAFRCWRPRACGRTRPVRPSGTRTRGAITTSRSTARPCPRGSR